MNVSRHFLLGLILAGIASTCYADAGEDIVFGIGTAVSRAYAEKATWPEGLHELSNDPRRTEILNSWFSDFPNDILTFHFELTTATDANALIEKFARVQNSELRVVVAAGNGPILGFKGKRRPGIALRVGNQAGLDAWFKHLKVAPSGERVFGVKRYAEAPKALVPTLTIYVDNEHIALKELLIPDNIEVVADEHWSWDREKEVWDGPPTAVSEFVMRHKSKNDAPRQD